MTGGAVVWTRSVTGTYSGGLSGAFTNLKTVIFCNGQDSLKRVSGKRIDNNSVEYYTDEIGVVSDSCNVNIEIRVYP